MRHRILLSLCVALTAMLPGLGAAAAAAPVSLPPIAAPVTQQSATGAVSLPATTAGAGLVPNLVGWGNGTGLGNPAVADYAGAPVATAPGSLLSGKTVTSLSVGNTQTCAVAVGRAYCWGLGAFGNRIVDSQFSSSAVPVAIDTSGVLAGKTVTAVSAGFEYACAVADGHAYCWGSNFSGQLGNGDSGSYMWEQKPVAVDASGALQGKVVTAISTGGDAYYSNTCAIADSQAYCWGAAWGPKPVPMDQGGILKGKAVTALSTGSQYGCVVAGGAAYCWGDSTYGEIGSSSPLFGSVPLTAVDTSGALKGKIVTAISASNPGQDKTGQFNTTCAIAGSQLFCWGVGNYGQLGQNSGTGSRVPVAVDTSGVLHGRTVTAVASGGFHVCAVASGHAYCWGRGEFGQVGDDRDTLATPLPIAVDGALAGSTVTAVAVSGEDQSGNSCAISSGSVYCWGTRTSGQLGEGNFGLTATPVPVSFGAMAGRTVTALAGSPDDSTCAVASGAVFCWGNGARGQLGNGTVIAQSRFAVAVDTSGPLKGRTVTDVSAGYDDNCVIADGKAFCWGRGGLGLGDRGDTGLEPHPNPVQVVSADVIGNTPMTAIASAGGGGTVGDHSCVIAGGRAYCWGDDTYGALGNVDHDRYFSPVDTSGVLKGKTVTAIAAGAFHSCAIADGAAYCWGRNSSGQLGNHSTTDSDVPVAVDATGALRGKPVTAISASSETTCAVADGHAYCWGSNSNGELGNNSRTNSDAPVAVSTSGVLGIRTVTSINTAALHSCAVADGKAFCWGDNSRDEIGVQNTNQLDVTTQLSLVPVAVAVAVNIGATARQTITSLAGAGTTNFALLGSNAPGSFQPVPPGRVLDTRSGVGAARAPVAGGSEVAVQIAGRAGVPAGAAAVVVNVTVTAATATGFVTGYADGAVRPGTSNLNFLRGQTVANVAVLPIGADGKVRLYNGSSGTVQLIADIAGYYLPGHPTVAGAFAAVPPGRVLDTRSGVGAARAPVAGGSEVAVQIAGRAGVPAGAAAVVVNVTVTAATATGFVTGYADGAVRPGTSNLNFLRGQTVANVAVLPIGADGKVRLYNGSSGTVQLIADIAGYYLP